MTTGTAPARPDVARQPRLADLTWNTVRQHRLALTGLAIVFAFFCLRLALTGLPLHATYSQYLLHHCVTRRHPGCGRLLRPMQASWVTRYSGVAVLPALIGVFLGAPLASRDFETGSYRFTLTQDVTGRRQLAVRLLLVGTIVIIGSCLVDLLSMWCLAPLYRIAPGYATRVSYWEPHYFTITAVLLPAWALLDFCAGVLAGVVIKRTVPAMAAALAFAVTLTVLGTGLQPGTLTEDLVAVAPVPARAVPVLYLYGLAGPPERHSTLASYPDGWRGPQGSWQVSGWFTGPDGRRLSGQAAQVMLNRIPARVAFATRNDRLRAWLASRRISYWIGVQPASRYWAFQAAAALILLAMAAAAALAAIVAFGRRT
jgi:hypothetical protein